MVTSRAGEPLPQPDLAEVGIEQVLRALADPVRLRIVRALADADRPMSCGAFGLGISKSTSTHHFRVLRDNGIISQHERGTSRYSELRSLDLEHRFPGLLPAVLAAAPHHVPEEQPPANDERAAAVVPDHRTNAL